MSLVADLTPFVKVIRIIIITSQQHPDFTNSIFVCINFGLEEREREGEKSYVLLFGVSRVLCKDIASEDKGEFVFQSKPSCCCVRMCNSKACYWEGIVAKLWCWDSVCSTAIEIGCVRP